LRKQYEPEAIHSQGQEPLAGFAIASAAACVGVQNEPDAM
jgi:hypothetical protein